MYTDLVNVQVIISLLKQYNIRNLVLSPGTRNVPFVHSVEQDPFFQCYSMVDERSAAYFALGLAEALHEPVCVSCTSSTATCNYMPAVKEAFEKHIPLIILSADRDYHYLYQMEDQMIDQIDMYRGYTNCAIDLPIVKCKEDEWFCVRKVNYALLELERNVGPIQINFQVSRPKVFNCKELPLYRKISRININDDEEIWKNITKKIKDKKKILILCGQEWKETKALEEELLNFFQNANVAISYDYLSNVSSEKFLKTVMVTEAMTEEEFIDFIPDLVITLGTHLWSAIKMKLRAYKGAFEHWSILPTGNIEDAFMGLTYVFNCESKDFFVKINKYLEGQNDLRYYTLWKKRIDDVKFPQLPFSNFYAIQELEKNIPEETLVHLSILNSTRLAQFSYPQNSFRCFSNLGADGIDGSLSTFLGQSYESKDKLNILITGDLSFLYDLNGLQMPINNNCRFLVINNFSGAEFHKNFSIKSIPMLDRHIAAGHNTKIEYFVKDMPFDYISAYNTAEFEDNLDYFLGNNSKPIVFEIFTDAEVDAKTVRDFYALNSKQSGKMKIRRFKRKVDKGIKRIKNILK